MIAQLNHIWPLIRQKDAEGIRDLRAQAALNKKYLLEIPTQEIKSLDEIELFQFTLEAYSSLAIFPDNDILNKFKEIGYNTIFLRWFIRLSDILSEFKKIEKDGDIKVMKPFAISFIKLHLDTKIKHELIQWQGHITQYKTDPETSLVYVSLLKLYKQRQTYRKNPMKHKDVYSLVMHGLLDNVERELGGTMDPEKFMKNSSKGKGEGVFLKAMVECIVKDETVSKRKFYILLYDLIRLIVKDYPLHTEIEFDKLKYEIDWDTYRYRRVEQIVDKK